MKLGSICQALFPVLSLTRHLDYTTSSQEEIAPLLPRAGAERDVYIVFKFDTSNPETLAAGNTDFPAHSALYIMGNDKDGPVQIEFRSAGNAQTPSVDRDLELRYMDYTTKESKKLAPNVGLKKAIKQGTMKLTNDELLNPETGKGPVQDALAQDPEYRSGPDNKGHLNTCHNLIQKLVKNVLGKEVTADALKLMDKYDELSIDPKINKVSIKKNVAAVEKYNPGPEGDPTKPLRIKRWTASEIGCGKFRLAKRAKSCSISLASDDKAPVRPGMNELSLSSNTERLPPEALDINENSRLPSQSIPDSLSEVDKVQKQGLVRVKGVLNSFTTISRPALAALGIAGNIAGAVFVILDFVNHNWVGAAIGGVGLAAGIAAGFALSGPLGWIVGGAIAVLFACRFRPYSFKKQNLLMLEQCYLAPLMTNIRQQRKRTFKVSFNGKCSVIRG